MICYAKPWIQSDPGGNVSTPVDHSIGLSKPKIMHVRVSHFERFAR
jgi:hypothetical protein